MLETRIGVSRGGSPVVDQVREAVKERESTRARLRDRAQGRGAKHWKEARRREGGETMARRENKGATA